jgi:Lhr-like helicase
MREFGFHPLIADWFASRFAAPTEPQRRGWPVIAAGDHTLIAAPTGSGKTLTAFLAVIDRLFREAEAGTLGDEIRVVYVSPLRALSNDMHRNLQTPLAEIAQRAQDAGVVCPNLRVGLRTGDTTPSQRAALVRRPPHLLVTTPESLYLLATSVKGRAALAHVETIIVDEIHALVRDKRGSHLALTMERLEALSDRPIQRIGLSATQKPLEVIGRYLVGCRESRVESREPERDGEPEKTNGVNSLWLSTLDSGLSTPCTIVYAGHQRVLDLGVEVPMDELGAVCTHEQWAVVHARLVELVQSHRSTLIFVNTRRMAERLTHQLSGLLGEDHVSSHHGSLSAEIRLKTEQRLKSGELKAVVATASLELGIDVGYIDLVIQIGSPRAIATFLQRVGRAGHSLHAIPKGRLIALSRDELLECLALLRAIRHGHLDAVKIPEQPLDVLVQQIVAETSFQEWTADDLFALCRRAYPYRNLTREEFEETLHWISDGFTENSSRRQSLVYYDRVNGRIRARPAARATAVGNAGAIPETAQYRVVAIPENTVIGSVDEDFAVESTRGDIFLLGNTSWRIEHVRQGDVAVSDAHGAPPTIPFWFGEAPGRTIELSTEVSALRKEIVDRLRGEEARGEDAGTRRGGEGEDENGRGGNDQSRSSTPTLPLAPSPLPPLAASPSLPSDWLITDFHCPPHAAEQIVEYVRTEQAALGLVPTQERVVFERFFDETGGMQLVIHAPFGAAINRAWGYALRKRFCRSFDFELQATADDDGVILSIGPQHSFPLEALFGMLTSHNVATLLEQAVLVQPPFQLRWRWNVTRALLVARTKFGKKVPPALQRFRADDLLTAVFPSLTGCQENHTGDIELPDHPLVRQTMHDCLHEALDLPGLQQVLRRVEAGEIHFVGRDTREPSPFCYELLNAYPYAFLDGGEIQERRARAVAPGSDLTSDGPPLTWLDPAAIEQVVSEAAPWVRSADELHDFLLSVIAFPASSCPPCQGGDRGGSSPVPSPPSAGERVRVRGSTERETDAGNKEPPLTPPWQGGQRPMPAPEVTTEWHAYFQELVDQRRAFVLAPSADTTWWVAIERWPAVCTLLPPRPPSASEAGGYGGTGVRGCGSAGVEECRSEGESGAALSLTLPPPHSSTPALPHLLPPGFTVPPGVRTEWDAISARVATCRGWMEFCGPIAAAQLAVHLGWTESQTAAALEALEGEGTILRGQFRPSFPPRPPSAVGEGRGEGAFGISPREEEKQKDTLTPDPSPTEYSGRGEKEEWCHRRLLARIHRLTLAGLRRQIEPVDVATFQRFLWQHHGLVGDERRTGTNGLFEVLAQLQGIDVPAVCWERDVLPARLAEYDPQWLDELCLTGETAWGRLFPPAMAPDKQRATGVTRVVPMSLFLRADLPWLLSGAANTPVDALGSLAAEVWELLEQHGALFATDLLQNTRMLPTHLEDALGELIGRGLVTADTFAGLRSLIAERKDLLDRPTRRSGSSLARRRVVGTVTGRWSIWRRPRGVTAELSDADRLTAWAWQLIRRWGVVFRDLLGREDGAPRWWELVSIFRRLEARGELRGGRFITGVAGEQFALETSLQQLRALRDADKQPDLVTINAADPLNLIGIITAPPRIPAQAQNRVAYLRGQPVAALQGGEYLALQSLSATDSERVHDALLQRAPREHLPPRRGNGRKPQRAEYPKQIPRPLIR